MIQVEGLTGLAENPTTTWHAPASAKVYDGLRAQILSLQLPPGTRLSRKELADRFGVSQSPIREALQRLEQNGLVATFRQSRTVVSMIDGARLRQEHFLRRAIECELVHNLASRADHVSLGKATAVIKMQHALADDLDQIDMFRQLDDQFHRELFIAADQTELHALVVERSSQMARLRALDLPSAGKVQSVIAGHQAVLDAIVAGDPIAAADQMRKHLSGSIERVSDIMAKNPHYFG